MHTPCKPRPWGLAVAAMGAIALWWILAVHFVYGDHWNALYCTGSKIQMPEWLESREPVYRVAAPVGYDGQWFHVLAHRPLEFRESARYMDAPKLRCQRILLPLAAWLLAFGKFEWVDPAYFLLVLASMGAGVWWTARLAQLRGASAAWGLAFLVLPASMSSIDRMLSDGPLVAAAAGFFFFVETGRYRAAWILAAAAPFIRETGLMLAAAAFLAAAWRRQWKASAAWLFATGPFLAWMWALRDLPGGTAFVWKGVFASALRILTQPVEYPFAPWLRLTLQAMDAASLAGFLAACGMTVVLVWRRRREFPDGRSTAWITGALYGAAALTLVHLEPRHAWDDFYSYGRVFSPIFLVLLLEGLERRLAAVSALMLAPVSARMALQFASPAWRIVRGISGL
ncbi:MAG: hypothetical protein ACUVS7_10190 [Bryobacteraceae bacterium]